MTATRTTPLPAALTARNPLLVADEWLTARLAQSQPPGPAARQVLQQLCCSAALHCFERGHGAGTLQRLLGSAGAVAQAVDRAFPDWTPGTAWIRATPQRALIREILARYRAARQLRSPALDRMLLEALICADLRGAGLSAFSRIARPAADSGPESDASALLAAGALIVGWLCMQTAEPWHLGSVELSVVAACAAAAGLMLLGPRPGPRRTRADAAPAIAALRRTLSQDSLDLRALASAMRAAGNAGIVWSAETLHLLVRLRVNALPRPGAQG